MSTNLFQKIIRSARVKNSLKMLPLAALQEIMTPSLMLSTMTDLKQSVVDLYRLNVVYFVEIIEYVFVKYCLIACF
jgi:hypothetical protein